MSSNLIPIKAFLGKYYSELQYSAQQEKYKNAKLDSFFEQRFLIQANKVVENLENDIYPEKEGIPLPKYISLSTFREKPHLIFEKRIDGKRLNLKMVLPEEYDIQEQLEKFNEKIKEKYE